MKKRGRMVATLIFSLLGVAIIIVLFMNLSIALATNEQFYKLFQAFDIKYTIHALDATPVNTVVTYPHKTSDYIYDIKENHLYVMDTNIETKHERGMTSIVSPLEKKITKPKQLIMSRIGNRTYIDSVPAFDINRLQCPNADIEKKTLLVAAFGSGAEKKLTDDLAKRLTTPATPFIIGNLVTGPGQSADVLVQISIGNYDTDINPIKVFYANNPKSQSLACYVANSIGETLETSGYSIIPTDDLTGTTIEIRIGNINIENNPMFEMGRTASAIKGGFRDA